MSMNQLSPPTNRSSKSGMTLVEIMVAMSIMTIIGFGTISGLLQARRMTEGSIYQNTAATVAQGYIEQLKNMDFALLDLPIIPDLINQGLPDSLIISDLPEDPEEGDEADVINVRKIDINNTPDHAGDDLELKIVAYIEDITDAAAGIGDARRLIVRYEYKNPSTGAAMGNTLYCIRSRVSTY